MIQIDVGVGTRCTHRYMTFTLHVWVHLYMYVCVYACVYMLAVAIYK